MSVFSQWQFDFAYIAVRIGAAINIFEGGFGGLGFKGFGFQVPGFRASGGFEKRVHAEGRSRYVTRVGTSKDA